MWYILYDNENGLNCKYKKYMQKNIFYLYWNDVNNLYFYAYL